MNLEVLIVSAILIAVIYFCYTMSANDHATDWIDDRLEVINKELEPYGIEVTYGRTWHDMAPCEVTFGLTKIGEELKYQLPSRKFKRLLMQLSEGRIDVETFFSHLEKYGDLTKDKPKEFKMR